MARFFWAAITATASPRMGGPILSMCNCPKESPTMSQADLMKLAIAGGLIYAAYKFGPSWAKAGAIGVGAVIVAKRVPYVKDVL
jgi:hypothetical protein